jgi:hypothetical protein
LSLWLGQELERGAVSVLSFVFSEVRFGASVGRELWFASGFRSVVIAWRFCGRLMKYEGTEVWFSQVLVTFFGVQ